MSCLARLKTPRYRSVWMTLSVTPAFSQAAIGGLLRGELGYDGVVITDDMRMGAIANHYGFETAIERAIAAGVDIVMLANNTLYEEDAVPRACAFIRQLVETGRITEERIDESCARIARMKRSLV